MASCQVNLNDKKYRHLLTPAICELSTSIQNLNNKATNGSQIILNIENDALEHIEQLILKVFNSILLSSPVNCIMNVTQEVVSSMTATSSSTNTNEVMSTNSAILDLVDAEFRVRQTLPRMYGETVCSKALSIVEKCRSFITTSKRGKLLKTFNDIHNITTSFAQFTSSTGAAISSNLSSSSSSFSSSPNIQPSSNNNELAQIFTLPIDRIHTILSKEIFLCKLDIFVTIYLVSALEFITKDILRLTTTYVRYLEKYSINRTDVKTAIYADQVLTKLFYTEVNREGLFDKFDYDDNGRYDDLTESHNHCDDLILKQSTALDISKLSMDNITIDNFEKGKS